MVAKKLSKLPDFSHLDRLRKDSETFEDSQIARQRELMDLSSRDIRKARDFIGKFTLVSPKFGEI